ncbi:MAG: MFS transporter [Chloroflexi bacterium]|nr:MFS transporter [Chloroflexota bacterium]
MILSLVNRSSFRVHAYRWYWFGNVLVHIAYLLQAVALGWYMLVITDSAVMVGMVAFAYGLPLLMVSPLSGLVADRLKRQLIVQFSLTIAVLSSAFLALLAATDHARPEFILLTSLALGATFAIYAPARMAILPNLVPEDMIFNASTLSYSGTRLMGFFGPVLAGFLLDLTNIAFTLTVQAAIFALGAFLYHKAAHFLPPPKQKRRDAYNILRGMWQVIAYLRQDRALFALVLMALVFVPVGMPYQKLMPLFVDRVLNEGPALLGLLVGSASMGSALSGFAVALIGDVYPKGWAILVFSALFGLGMVVFAFMSESLIALGLIFVIGIFSGIFLTLINALLLIHIKDELRGRMMSVWGMVWGLIPISALIGGTVAEFFGISIVMAAAGACVAFTCILMIATRSPLLDL